MRRPRSPEERGGLAVNSNKEIRFKKLGLLFLCTIIIFETPYCLIPQNETAAVLCLICLILPSKTRPDLLKSQDWTNPQKSLTIPYIHGFQTEGARQFTISDFSEVLRTCGAVASPAGEAERAEFATVCHAPRGQKETA